MTSSPYRFLFLVGASGSGTTLLTRLLSAPPDCVGLGGNHISIPRSEKRAYGIARRFKKANDRLWDRKAGVAKAEAGGREMLSLIEELRALPGYGEISRVIFKRSAPFHRGDRYRPDLLDLDELFPGFRVVAVYRDPRASTASSHRRRFARNLRACAVITDEQLTYLAAQLSALPEDKRLTLSYESLCRQPERWSQRIAEHCGIGPDDLQRSILAEGLDPTRNEAWRQRLSSEEVAFLDRYFDERRCSQWALLDRLRED